MEREDKDYTNCNWCTWNNPQRICKETGRLGNKKIIGDHPDYGIFKMVRILRRVLES